MEAFVENSPKFRVGMNTNVVPAYVPVSAPGYFEKAYIPVPRILCHGCTELTKVPVRVIPGKYPGWVWFCTYLTEHNLGSFRKNCVRIMIWSTLFPTISNLPDYFLDNVHTGLAFGIRFMTFWPKTFVVMLGPHAVHALCCFFFLSCILHVYVHALLRRLETFERSKLLIFGGHL